MVVWSILLKGGQVCPVPSSEPYWCPPDVLVPVPPLSVCSCVVMGLGLCIVWVVGGGRGGGYLIGFYVPPKRLNKQV